MKTSPHRRRGGSVIAYLAFAITWLICGSWIAGAQQLPPPPGMTANCSPNPVYDYAPMTCTIHVGGGATGSVAVVINNSNFGSYALDSAGDAYLTIPAGYIAYNGIFEGVATYQGDSQYSSVSVGTGSLYLVDKPVVTAQTLACSPYELYTGTAGSCAFDLTATGATGTVAFSVNGTAWMTVPLDSNGRATATGGFSQLPAGSYTVQALYSGDANFSSTPTSTVIYILDHKPLPSAMKVGCTPAPIAAGASGACTVRVAGGVTGSVDLTVQGQPVAQGVMLDATGMATIPGLFTELSVGTYGVVALYKGDANFGPASAGTSVTVQNGASVTPMSLTCTPDFLVLNQTATCTATVEAGATGNIIFTIDGQAWTAASIDSRGRATTAPGFQGLPAANHTVYASYAGDDNVDPASASVSVPITAQPTTRATVNLTCSPTTVIVGESTNCTVKVGSGGTGAVILYEDGNLASGAGLDGNGVAVFEELLANVSPGTHSFGVTYSGDLNVLGGVGPGSSSTTTVQVVSQQASSALTATVSPTSIQNGGQVTLRALVGQGATGTVTITSGAQQIAQLTLGADGFASTLVDFNEASGNGTYPLTFTYSGDANFQGSTQVVSLTVSAQGTSAPTPPTTNPTPGSLLYSYSITQSDGSTSGYAPNGNIVAYTDSINGQWTASYDGLNRITTATQSPISSARQNVPAAQSLCWVYDSFGNRTLQARAPSPLGQCIASTANGENFVSATYNAANQMTSVAGEAVASGVSNGASWPVSSDPAGNITTDARNNYFYDGEGRICAVQDNNYGALVGYLYDAEGQRVARGNIYPPPNTDPCDLSTNGFQMTTEYIPGPNGEQLTVLDWSTGSAKWLRTNAFAGGQLVATYGDELGTNNNVHFHLTDWLGTRRMRTDYMGNPEQTCLGGSFGDALNCTTTGSATDLHFTGKERDSESGLDYFQARYYGSAVGRWTSPDPSGLYLADPENPQTLNLYSYVGNNPLSFVDPLGLCNSALPAGESGLGTVIHAVGNFFCNLFSGEGDSSSGNQGSNGTSSPGAGIGAEPNYNLFPGVNPFRSSSLQTTGITAARQALGPTSQADPNGKKFEFGGLLLRDKNRQYTFTNPVTFGDSGHFWTSHVMVPFGYRKAGSYHTHPGPTIPGVTNGMSIPDANHSDAQGLPEFMGEEGTGRVWKYDPYTGCTAEPCGAVIFDPHSQPQ